MGGIQYNDQNCFNQAINNENYYSPMLNCSPKKVLNQSLHSHSTTFEKSNNNTMSSIFTMNKNEQLNTNTITNNVSSPKK
jgi:hypothetical protein